MSSIASLQQQPHCVPTSVAKSSPASSTAALPPSLHQSLWRGSDLANAVSRVVPTGFARLDAELPGGGWPCSSLTELLAPQPGLLEWRLLGRALRGVVAGGEHVVLIGPPKHPHLPGLRHEGIDEHSLVWIQAETPAERLWATEQLVKANAAGALLAWLPHARPEQLRRLQVCALSCDAPVFLIRPEAARHDASAAPLRVRASFGLDWELRVHLLKRRGPALDDPIVLPSVPGGLAAVLTPRLRKPSRLLAAGDGIDALGSPVVDARGREHALQ